MNYINLIFIRDDVKILRPDWLESDCCHFIEKYGDAIYSSLGQYGRELLQNFLALEDIENGALNDLSNLQEGTESSYKSGWS